MTRFSASPAAGRARTVVIAFFSVLMLAAPATLGPSAEATTRFDGNGSSVSSAATRSSAAACYDTRPGEAASAAVRGTTAMARRDAERARTAHAQAAVKLAKAHCGRAEVADAKLRAAAKVKMPKASRPGKAKAEAAKATRAQALKGRTSRAKTVKARALKARTSRTKAATAKPAEVKGARTEAGKAKALRAKALKSEATSNAARATAVKAAKTKAKLAAKAAMASAKRATAQRAVKQPLAPSATGDKNTSGLTAAGWWFQVGGVSTVPSLQQLSDWLAAAEAAGAEKAVNKQMQRILPALPTALPTVTAPGTLLPSIPPLPGPSAQPSQSAQPSLPAQPSQSPQPGQSAQPSQSPQSRQPGQPAWTEPNSGIQASDGHRQSSAASTKAPSRSVAVTPSRSQRPTGRIGESARSNAGRVVLALPKRVAQATGLSVGVLPLILLIVVVLVGLGLVIIGTRRKMPDEN